MCDVDSSRSQSESYTQVNISDITHGMFYTEANRAAGVEATLYGFPYLSPSWWLPFLFVLFFLNATWVFRQRWRSRKSNTDLIHQFGSGLNLVWKCQIQCDLCWKQSRFGSLLMACGSTLPHGDAEAFSTCTFLLLYLMVSVWFCVSSIGGNGHQSDGIVPAQQPGQLLQPADRQQRARGGREQRGRPATVKKTREGPITWVPSVHSHPAGCETNEFA